MNFLVCNVKIGDVKIVEELLKSKYRSLGAKDQLGQTAVHLACQLNENIILRKLIAAKANVNCRDTEGNTPLHVSSLLNNHNQSNFIDIKFSLLFL